MTRLPLSLRRGAKSELLLLCVVTTTSEKWAVTLRTAWKLDHIFFLDLTIQLDLHLIDPSKFDWSRRSNADAARVATKKKPLQATNDVLFKTRIFPLCQCLKILIWFFCSIQSGFWKKNIINLEKWQCIEGRQNVEQLLMTLLPWTKRKRSRPRTFW